MNTALKLLRWSGIATLILSVGCVTTSYSRALLSNNKPLS